MDCRPKQMATDVAAAVSKGPSLAPKPVSLSVDDILTITCQLCRSSLMVNESKLGTEVTCPDCHSKTLVTRPNKKAKRKTGRPQPKSIQRSFDADAELRLEEPVERPTVDHASGVDDSTDMEDDLLTAPLPELDPLPESSQPFDQSGDAESAEDEAELLANEPAMTRRQRYERMQQRAMSEGREQMRKRARKKLAAKKTGSAMMGSGADSGDDTPRRRKRRRRRKGQGDRGVRMPGWVQPAFGWVRRRSLMVAWVLAAGCLSVVYAVDDQWGPVALLDRGYQMFSQSPTVLDLRLIVNAVLLMVGSVLLYFVCGRSFATNAEDLNDHHEKADAGLNVAPETNRARASSLFTTVHFASAWLLAGLPFLYASILVVPAQFLFVPPLLVGGWLNGSVWRFVCADGLIRPDQRQQDRRLWRAFYIQQVVAAVIAIPAVMMVQAGGTSAVIGCFLMGGIMIGMAGICGRHCRQLSNSLEPSA